MLLGSDTDPLGMPRLVVQWRFRDTELDSICRAYRVLAHAVAKSGLGEVQLDPDLLESVQRALVPQGGHHIGTVRMGADASASVVDTHGEVWGTHGLFVAGTAIFPTSGFANPTLTAVALAFRLAEHLVRRAAAEPSSQSCQYCLQLKSFLLVWTASKSIRLNASLESLSGAMSRWHYWVSGFFLLDTMAAFGFTSRMVYGDGRATGALATALLFCGISKFSSLWRKGGAVQFGEAEICTDLQHRG